MSVARGMAIITSSSLRAHPSGNSFDRSDVMFLPIIMKSPDVNSHMSGHVPPPVETPNSEGDLPSR